MIHTIADIVAYSWLGLSLLGFALAMLRSRPVIDETDRAGA